MVDRLLIVQVEEEVVSFARGWLASHAGRELLMVAILSAQGQSRSSKLMT
jgi:hypothetical protein